uniref:C2 domain-containing protein n=1 Tax=Strongyloides papillosus TaxID=174720 RepID=A0A0N5BJG5_STREA
MYILIIFFTTFVSLTNSISQNHFWVVGEILSVQWKRGCLSAERCTNPRFQILSQQIDIEDIQRIDFPLHSTSTRNVIFNNYFPTGNPESLLMTIKIIGIDPLYNIPLDCDKSSNIRTFPIQNVNHSSTTEKTPSLIEFEGKCFTAIIQLKKYDTICPWCSEGRQLDEKDNKTISHTLALGEVKINQTTFIIILGFLLTVIFITTVSLSILLLRQRNKIKTKRRDVTICRYPQIPSTKIKIGVSNDEDYETIDDKEKLTSVYVKRNSCYSSGYQSSQTSATSIHSNHLVPQDYGSNFI